jgi:hypothetical protein
LLNCQIIQTKKMSTLTQLRPKLVRTMELEITWDDYPCIQPGEYLAICRTAKLYRDPGFKRWVCLLLWDVVRELSLDPIARRVPMWLNLGEGPKPHAGRRSRYLQEWIRANDGRPPNRGDRVSPRIFSRRLARVQIEDANSQIPYSKVGQILSWETG